MRPQGARAQVVSAPTFVEQYVGAGWHVRVAGSALSLTRTRAVYAKLLCFFFSSSGVCKA